MIWRKAAKIALRHTANRNKVRNARWNGANRRAAGDRLDITCGEATPAGGRTGAERSVGSDGTAALAKFQLAGTIRKTRSALHWTWAGLARGAVGNWRKPTTAVAMAAW